MQAAIILVGDELLAGHTRDANGHYLAQRLTALGHRLRALVMIPDEPAAIVDAIDALLPRVDIVFLSGGLGPTHDDRTTECVAHRFHRRLVMDDVAWTRMQARYNKRGDIPPATVEAARKMVLVPEGSEPLENPVGAAPGYVVREGDHTLVVMPGVPAELQAIFEEGVLGKVLPRGTPVGLVQLDIEMPEAAFARALSQVADRFADVEIGSYPHFGERRVTLRFRGDVKRAQAALDAFLAAVPDARRSPQADL